MTLTKTQEVVFEFIKLYMEKYHRSPTRQEICDAFEFRSTNTAECYIKALKKKGLLKQTPRMHRGLELCNNKELETA